MNTNEYQPRRFYPTSERVSPSAGPLNVDPDKGYARMSYNYRPPELPGFKVCFIKAHQRGSMMLPDRWFYTKVDKDGLMYRGRNAAKRMKADGLNVSIPDVREVPSPDNISAGGSNVHPRRTRAKLYATNGKKRVGRRGPYKKKMVGAQIVAKERASATTARPLGLSTSVWVPVRGAGEAIHGWFDLRHGQYVRVDQLQPEGLAGTVYRSGTLVFTESFVDALDEFTKVK